MLRSSAMCAQDLSFRERYGLHRVLEPAGALPQAAERLDSSPERRSAGELLIAVETLNVDSASMRQIASECHDDTAEVGRAILDIVGRRGKLQNPVTGSGGMLLGRVESIGSELAERFGLAPGDRVATLVSLTLTPLHLRAIRAVHLDTHQVDVEGTAVVFPSGAVARMPTDLPERLALAVLDVAGAAPQVERLVQGGGSVCILGAGGKSGLLVAAAAREGVGSSGIVIGVESLPVAADAARRVGSCDQVLSGDATDPLAIAEAALSAAGEPVRNAGGFDVVVSCVNVPGAELSAILMTRERGTVYFFSMATSFARAALGAEGISKDVDLMIGNGYCLQHAERSLALVRRQPGLLAELRERFA